ncbi:hypothetical protein HDU96_004191 [Phlyctochytrium bullatum]|nr:hypothetical protein HDU96_004191 [Phlyctochytrium bullatum]
MRKSTLPTSMDAAAATVLANDVVDEPHEQPLQETKNAARHRKSKEHEVAQAMANISAVTTNLETSAIPVPKIRNSTPKSLDSSNKKRRQDRPHPLARLLSLVSPSVTSVKQHESATTTHAKNLLASYPWLLSSVPARPQHLNEPIPVPNTVPGFWDTMKQNHLLQLGINRAKVVLHDPAYEFPHDFQRDAAKVFKRFLGALSDPSSAASEDQLSELMLKRLAREFVAGWADLQSKGRRAELSLKDFDAPASAPTPTPTVHVKSLYFTYGPYPVPPGYISQAWLGLFTIVIPEEDAHFVSHPRQKRVLRAAEDDGCYFTVRCRIPQTVYFRIVDEETGAVVLRDRREGVEVEFISPHFTPWDEIFELQPDGTWKLRWMWRLSDVDSLLSSRVPRPVATSIQVLMGGEDMNEHGLYVGEGEEKKRLESGETKPVGKPVDE